MPHCQGIQSGVVKQILVFHLPGARVTCLMLISHPDFSEAGSEELHRGHRENQCNGDRVSSGRVLRVFENH